MQEIWFGVATRLPSRRSLYLRRLGPPVISIVGTSGTCALNRNLGNLASGFGIFAAALRRNGVVVTVNTPHARLLRCSNHMFHIMHMTSSITEIDRTKIEAQA